MFDYETYYLIYILGTGGIGKRILESITTPLELFTILKGRCYLKRDNVVYLQQMLRKIGRKDLVRKAIDYSRSVGDVLHFYPASEQPGLPNRHLTNTFLRIYVNPLF